MRTDKYLWDKVIMPMYREMYQKSEPSVDIDKLIADGTTKKENWFRDYYLSKEEFEGIYERICKERKLSEKEKVKVSFEVFLGAGPTSVRPTKLKKTKK